MAFYLWMFPLLFIFHDMEEIIGLVPWIRLNETLLAQKAPTILKIHKEMTTEGFALAVFEEFFLVLSITLLAYFTQSRVLELVWLGGICSLCASSLAPYRTINPSSQVYPCSDYFYHLFSCQCLFDYRHRAFVANFDQRIFPIFTGRFRHRRHQSPFCSLAWEKIFHLACP